MLRLTKILYDSRISQAKIARLADINQSDLNSMIHGKRPAYPAWRTRISQALRMPEHEVFPEYAENLETGGQ